MAHIYDIGTRAWQPDVTDGWVASEVSDKQIDGDKVKLVFQLDNGEVCPPICPPSALSAPPPPLTMPYSPRPSRRRCSPSRRAMTLTCPP
jgi:hypothetical protein